MVEQSEKSARKSERDTIKNQRRATREILWQKSGFQRILGGYWHNYIFNLGILLFGLVMLGIIFPNYILPFPEALGYNSIISSLFGLVFTLFDVGISEALKRFVSEHVGRGNISKAVEYVRFFVWWQAITGLIQISLISLWALYFAINSTNYASLVFMFLIYSLIQYPGMLEVFKYCIEGFQRFDKVNIVNFLQMVVFELITQIACILLGRWWGIRHPAYGELLGATYGYILGLYIDNFLAMFLSGYFFKNILKKYKIKLIETIRPRVSKDVIKKSLKYGWKSMGQSIFFNISSLLITTMAIIWLPSYATIIGLFQVADTITRIVIQDPPTLTAISESYNCGKMQLTQYYTQSTFKWYGILTIFLTVEVIQLVPPILVSVASSYAKAADLIPWLLISRFFIGPIHFSDQVHKGCDKPEYAMYSLFVQMSFRALFFLILLAPKALPSLFDNYNYIAAYCIADLPSVLAKNVFAWWIVNKYLYKVKINWWQTIFAPLFSILPIILLNIGIIYGFQTLSNGIFYLSVLLSIVVLLSIFFISPLILMFMLGFVGGFDDRGLIHLRDAAILSGSMKWMVMGMYNLSKWGLRISPLKNFSPKFAIPHIAADKEAEELNKMREIV